jgi:transcriptional regulator with XRE-family HTH domain
MNIEIANRLLQYRKASGLSQEELAEKIGVSRQAVSKWERSEASPDTDNLILLAEVYGVTLDELLRGKSEDPKAKEDTADDFTPDENTTYSEKKHVSFKNGIHVRNEKDTVDISFKEGINVKSDDGTRVHVGTDGIHVHDGEKVRAYTNENGHIMVDDSIEHNENSKEKALKRFPAWAVSLGIFFAWGFSGVFFGWTLAWISFLLIPVYYSLVDAVFKRNPSHFAYPVLCVIFQMITGFVFGGWHWGWIAYLTIPIYYGIAVIFKKPKNK